MNYSPIILNVTYYLLLLFFFLVIYILLTKNYLRNSTYFTINFSIILSISVLLFFDQAYTWYIFYLKVARASYANSTYSFGIDNLSIFLVLLSCFLLIICLLLYWFMKYKVTLYTLTLLLSVWLLLNVFTILDLFFFFFFFEAVLIPMYYLVGIWGSRGRKIYAGYQLFIYTLLGSFFMMIAFFDIYMHTGTTSYLLYDLFMTNNYSADRQYFIWFFLFLAFAVKIPLSPFHIWLPEAHVEAPTPGSVLLAGVILKLGSYGVIRYIYEGPFIVITDNLIFVTYVFALIGFIYCAFVALNQPNMKKVIAYSSVSHMNFALLGLLTGTIYGYSGMILMMMAHGIAAAALFICLGVLYDKHKSLIIHYYSGFAKIMPIFTIMFFFVVLANIAFPGTFNFVGELLITLGIVRLSLITGIIVNIGLIITLVYSLAIFTRIFFGILKNVIIYSYCDASRLEVYILILFALLIVAFGIYPDVFIKFITTLLAKLFN